MVDVTRLQGEPPSPWERQYGYSRVVTAGGFVLIGGTTSVDENGVVVGETPYDQTIEIFRKLEREFGRAGATLEEVVQLRVYVTDISRADDVGRAYHERFEQIQPVITMVEVSALIDPRMSVEIEAVARVSG